MVHELSAAQQQLQSRIAPAPGENQEGGLTAGGAAFKKAEGLQRSIAQIVTESQPVNASGNRGRMVNIVT